MTTAPERAEKLRQEIRHFCASVLPDDLRAKVANNHWLDREDYQRYNRLLSEHNLLVGHWPAAYGGRDWSPYERFIFEEETSIGNAPWLVPMAVGHVGPVIYTFGSEEQKQRFLPPIRKAEVWWSQGYSEPGAGSDLASLRTKAVRKGDHYIVTGQKIWTSFAHWGDWLYCLVRTSNESRPQQGISFLLIDLKSPGITIRPIVTMEMLHHLNEVFLDEVKVPAANLVGEEGRGWDYAKFLLANERVLVAETGRYHRQLQQLHAMIASLKGKAHADDFAALQQRYAELSLRLFSLRALFNHLLFRPGSNDLGPQASMLKIRGTELQQDLAEALIDCLGLGAVIYDPTLLIDTPPANTATTDPNGLVREHLYARATTIFGGSNEIQRNILAKAVLGF